MGAASSGAGSRVGLIGLGRMGSGMLARLVERGFAVQVYDIDPDAVGRAAATAGCRAMPSAAAAAQGCQFIITMLPDSEEVAQALLGTDGIVATAAQGATVLEMSSGSPWRTIELGAQLERYGLRLVDAPVSGGISGARAGSLTIMVGGAAEAVESAMPILSALGTTIRRVGPLGSGHALKAVNNSLYAVALVAGAEALTTLKRYGIDSRTAVEVLCASSGGSWALDNRIRRNVLTRDFTSAMSASLMLKDIRHGVSLTERVAGSHRTLDVAEAVFERYCEAEGAEVDFGVVRQIEREVGIEIS